MTFSVVIPARLDSTRLPGKVLLDLAGKSMLQRTWEQACSSSATRVTIATDDIDVQQAAENFGAEAVMTSTQHRSGTDRIHEVVMQQNLADQHIVVNVQADEPLIPPAVIDQVANDLQELPEAGIATLCEQIKDNNDLTDSNAVKVVRDVNGFALYFSRACIPWQASTSAGNCFRHVGIYAYRVGVLKQFVQWPPAELELSEKLEQLRALSNGVRIHVAPAETDIPPGIDTELDLERARRYLHRVAK